MRKSVFAVGGVLLLLVLLSPLASAQQNPKPQPSDDVLRINTELVQTIVTVTDKQGQFVDGLKKESFELRVDSQAVPIAFFLSDGFLADTGSRGRIATNQLNRLTDKARRAGAVIYTIDARGLVSGSLDATGLLRTAPPKKLLHNKRSSTPISNRDRWNE